MKEFMPFLIESNNQIGYMLVDLELKVVFANEQMVGLYPVAVGEPLRAKTKLKQVLDLSIKQNKAIAGFPIHETVDGKPRHVLLYTHPYRENGVISALAAIVCDISPLFQSFQNMIHQEKLQLFGDMAAGTANVILNPLAVIKGVIQLIEQSIKKDVISIDLPAHPLNQKLNEYFALLYEQVKQIDDILQSFLLVGKTSEMKLAPLSVVPFFREAVAKFQNEAMERSITLICEYPNTNTQVLSREDELTAALKALVKNAFDATEKGGTVKLQTLVTETSVNFIVVDYGGGIPKKNLENIKKPFFTTKENALGIGLNICESIVQKMGGTLTINSVDMTTEARIMLPKIR
jgi:signal transduction histidine kinase